MSYKEDFIQDKEEQSQIGMVPHDFGVPIIISLSFVIVGTLLCLAFSNIELLQKLNKLFKKTYFKGTVDLGDSFGGFAILGGFVSLILYVSQ